VSITSGPGSPLEKCRVSPLDLTHRFPAGTFFRNLGSLFDRNQDVWYYITQ
jgi:hypothetical protein